MISIKSHSKFSEKRQKEKKFWKNCSVVKSLTLQAIKVGLVFFQCIRIILHMGRAPKRAKTTNKRSSNSWIHRIDTVRMAKVLKVICKFSIVIIKITVDFFKLGKTTLNFTWNKGHTYQSNSEETIKSD